MNIKYKKAFVICLLIMSLLAGCEEGAKTTKGIAEAELGTTIGEVTEIFLSEPIAVEGYALVGGLRGTGSSQCPTMIRSYLRQYILKQLPEAKSADKYIDSPNTAVVYVSGNIPAMAQKGQRFDVKVAALAGTQTRSLEGGILWGVDLKAKGRFGISSKILARAEGPIYIDKIDGSSTNKKEGFVPGGGRVLDEYLITMVVHRPSYRSSAYIRNRINQRYGFETAKAMMLGQIKLEVPAKYKGQERKFISLVKATYLNDTPALIQNRVDNLIESFIVAGEKDEIEIALEAIGTPSSERVASLLNSSVEEIRFRAARCLLNMGDDRGLGPLRVIALNKRSSYRLKALEAIAKGARANDISAICRSLLRAEDFTMRLAAYEQLAKLDDISIIREQIGDSLYLDKVDAAKEQNIYVSRSGVHKVVLFGAQIYCRPGTFIRSDDGSITIDAPLNSERVRLIRKVADVPPISTESSYELSDIIRGLCEEAIIKDKTSRKPGLNVSYSDMIALLKKMCDKGAVPAEFKAGPLPKID